MAQSLRCPRCGALNPPDSQYCDQCSLNLRQATGTSAPAGPPPGTPGVSAPPRRPEGSPLVVSQWNPPSAPPPDATAAGAPPPGPAPYVAPPPPQAAPPGPPPAPYVPPPGPGSYVSPPAPPPGPGYAVAPPRRGNRPVLLIVGTVVAVLLFVGAGVAALLASQQTDEHLASVSATLTALAGLPTSAPPAPTNTSLVVGAITPSITKPPAAGPATTTAAPAATDTAPPAATNTVPPPANTAPPTNTVPPPPTNTMPPPTNTVPPSPTPLRLGPLGPQPPTRISASGSAPPSTDSQGQTTTFDPANAVDGKPDTTWRVAGDGSGQFLLLEYAAPVRVQEIRLIPGYAKVDPASGVDRFQQNRRVQRVRFEFSDGSTQEADFADQATLQPVPVGPVVTNFVRIVILQTTAPGAQDGRDFTAISEVEVLGRPLLP